MELGKTCMACGRRPAGRKLRVSEKFTAFPDFFAGSLLCDVCATLVEGREYRSGHWLLLPDGTVKLLSRRELLEALRDLPIGSLAYVRSRGRKHGFIRCLRLASTSTLAAVCGEDECPGLVPRDRLRALIDLAEEAYKALKRKGALLEGCSAREWEHEELCRRIEEVRGDPLWRVITRAL